MAVTSLSIWLYNIQNVPHAFVLNCHGCKVKEFPHGLVVYPQYPSFEAIIMLVDPIKVAIFIL